ncbi:MAG: ferredoxin-type protein NapF [Gammaproteobacteria bacterium]|nr:ferredoxin-type protein NapF [Gammaproteobacteria bacterium]MDH5592967.1 ferredoxin-type protein NapF [Gammaproteobacteria bacterium]MDH5613612.1 ferredoxin-type protein NapF [Gammaproteobacteria bacterium]
MTAHISRAQFLRGDFRGKKTVIRPPWSQDEPVFTETCTTCSDCIKACPESILLKGRASYPVVDFENGECTFCGLCAEVCQTSSINKLPDTPPWSLKAVITDSCLAKKGIVCVSCQEECEQNAIKFIPVAGHIPAPDINISSCTGCGACYGSCPVNSISISQGVSA